MAVLLAYGYTNNQLARSLAISTRTAEMHRHNAMDKLGVHSRAEITRWALDEHLLHHTLTRSRALGCASDRELRRTLS